MTVAGVLGDRIRLVVILAVTTAWLGNLIAAVAVQTWEPNEALNGLMMAIVGALFATGHRRQENDR